MTIELITGTPGAGKTTYAVAVRLLAECKRSVTIDDETCVKLGLDVGTKVMRRLVCAGVRGLKLEHERLPHVLTRDAVAPSLVERWNAMQTETDDRGKVISESDVPVHQRLPGEPAREDVQAIVQNWWLWCKPGDLIVIDEAQFVMPRGTLGRKPPYWIQAMEIHRHYGVDFLIITQHPGLIDTTVRHLVGQHTHVRSVMGSPLCMLYIWDHASNPERFSLASKGKFFRRAKHYRLFHSSSAHLKPPAAGRAVLVIVPLLLGFAWFSGWGKDGLMTKLYGDKGGDKAAVSAGASGVSAPRGVVPGSGGHGDAVAVPAAYGSVVSVGVAVRGCWSMGARCECIGDGGRKLFVEEGLCRRSSAPGALDDPGSLVRFEPSRGVRYESRDGAVSPSGAASGPGAVVSKS